MELFTPEDIRKYFYASCILAIICLLFSIIAIGLSGQADTTGHMYIKGQVSSMDTEQHFAQYTSRTAAEDKTGQTTVDYRTNQQTTDTGNATVSTSIVFLDAKGGLMTRHEVTHYGAKRQIQSKLVDIKGNVSADDNFQVTILPSGEQRLDSQINVDASGGKIKWRFKLVNSTTGRPATEQEVVLVGNVTIDAYNNVTSPVRQLVSEESWLPACAEMDKDIYGMGLYTLPINDSWYNYVRTGNKVNRVLNITG